MLPRSFPFSSSISKVTHEITRKIDTNENTSSDNSDNSDRLQSNNRADGRSKNRSNNRANHQTAAFYCLLIALAALALGVLNERTASLASNTMLLCLAVTICVIPISFALAVALYLSDMPWRRGAKVALALGLFVPLYLQAAGWNAGFGPLGWQTSNLDAPWLMGWRAAVWVHTVAAIPWATLIIGAGLAHSHGQSLEAAMLVGSPWQVLWHIVIPSAAAPVLTASLWVIVSVAAEMTVADLFLIRTYAEELYTGFALGQSTVETIAMLAPSLVGLGALSLATAVAIYRQSQRWGNPLPLRRLLFGSSPWTTAFVGLAFAVMYVVPIGSLIWQVGSGGSAMGWTALGAWEQLSATPAMFGNELRWSLVIASLAASVAVAMGLALAAWGRRGWPAAVNMVVAAVALAAPGPLWALLVLWLLNRPGLSILHTRTILSPVLAIAVRCLPLAILILWRGLRSIPDTTIDAAKLDGASRWQLARWLLPMRWSTVATAWTVCLALAMGDLAGSILVMPPAVETAAVRLFGLLHAGVREQEAALALVAWACSGLLGAVALLAAGKMERRATQG